MVKGIVININPVIVEFGGIALRWYGLAVISAVAFATLVATREAGRKGVLPTEILNLLPWVLVAGIFGARLFHVIDNWDYFLSNPRSLFNIEQGGLAIWGALAGGGVAALVYAVKTHIHPGLLADILTPGLLVGQIIGRFGCIINGDATGGATTLPWGFIYTHPGSMVPAGLFGVPTHPYPVYEMLWNIVTLAVLLGLRRRFAKNGLLFLTYLSIYSIGRFLLSFLRTEKSVFWGLQQAQVLAIAVLLIASGLFVFLSSRQIPETKASTAQARW